MTDPIPLKTPYDCPYCHGLGWTESSCSESPHLCPVCSGRGWIVDDGTRNPAEPDRPPPQWKPQ